MQTALCLLLFFGGFMALEDGSLQLVTFQLGEELYSVDIMKVKEIVKLQSIRTIPNSPDYIEGILNLRKEIIPIINLHKRFDIKESIKSEEDALLGGFIILQIKDSKIGIIIDRIARVVEINVKDIQPPPQMITGIGAEYIQPLLVIFLCAAGHHYRNTLLWCNRCRDL